VFTALLNCTVHVEASRGGFSELLGCTLHLTDPRARLSRTEEKGKIFSALGELMWYLSGHTRLDFIDYYVPGTFAKESDDGQTVRSGYGERLMSFRGIDQLSNVIRLLRERGTTRRAVIQLFDAAISPVPTRP
jgi:thymidylate synthase